jgi:hypothetical protein
MAGTAVLLAVAVLAVGVPAVAVLAGQVLASLAGSVSASRRRDGGSSGGIQRDHGAS